MSFKIFPVYNFSVKCIHQYLAHQYTVVKYIDSMIKVYIVTILCFINFQLTLPGKADDMKGKILYALKGVIVHKGSLQFGHYYTFLRTTEKLPSDYQHDAYHDELSKIEGDWYCANDNSITRISDVQSGMPAKVAKSPGYLLFYERL